MPNPKLISCQVMIDEVRPFLPAGVATEVLEMSLHARPELLRDKLQLAIDASDGAYDPIYLGYGLCGKAVVGLAARQSSLVVIKNDDCIGIFLGSLQARRDQLAKEAGTYFLSPGWVGAETGSVFSEYDRMVQKYGQQKAERMLGMMMRHYKRLVYIRMPHATTLEPDREYARSKAAKFQMSYEELDGTPRLLQRLVEQQWDEEFIVVPPGRAIMLEDFLAARSS